MQLAPGHGEKHRHHNRYHYPLEIGPAEMADRFLVGVWLVKAVHVDHMDRLSFPVTTGGKGLDAAMDTGRVKIRLCYSGQIRNKKSREPIDNGHAVN
ncbi:hypothetical protein [Pelagibacterium sp.]|uniref:hypothetical protein n=1 Tax=Pelagibacterium sp. TaxID=1967288 RepID=UPI003A903649